MIAILLLHSEEVFFGNKTNMHSLVGFDYIFPIVFFRINSLCNEIADNFYDISGCNKNSENY